MAGGRGGMHANCAADSTRLSCPEYTGPKGEGKFRVIERQWMFTAVGSCY
jgi:hypothetical protein